MNDCNTFRVCTKCGQSKPLTTEYFQPRKEGKQGFNSQCRECRRKAAKDWPSQTSEKHKATKAARAKHPEVVERRNKRRRERYANDPEFKQYLLDGMKKRRDRDPEKTKVRKHNEYQRHKARYKKWKRKYYLANRPKLIKQAKGYKRNPITAKVSTQRRLARKRNLPDTLTKQQWLDCLAYFNNQCAVCGKPFSNENKPYMDHWIPLSDPNCPGTVARNIIPLCGGSGGCNESKHDLNAVEWLNDFYSPDEVGVILERITRYITGRL